MAQSPLAPQAAKWGLTARSSRAPTPRQQARPGGARYIFFASPGLASRLCRPLSSNVMPHMTHCWCALLIAGVFGHAGRSYAAESPPVRAPALLVVDMPYGGCRLVVRQDGSGSLFYGALPQSIEVGAGTFEPLNIASALKARSVPSSERGSLAAPVGGIQLGENSETLWFSDVSYAKSLFKRALRHRLKPTLKEQNQSRLFVSKACTSPN